MRNVEPAETLALHSMCSAVSKCHWESLDGSWRSSHYQPHIGRARPAQCCWKKKEHQSCRIPESMSRTLTSRYPASDISHLWVCYLGTNQTSTLKEGNGFSVSRSISFRCFQEIKVPISNASPQLPTGHVLWQQLPAPGLWQWKSCGPIACGTKILAIAMTGFTNWHLWQNVAWICMNDLNDHFIMRLHHGGGPHTKWSKCTQHRASIRYRCGFHEALELSWIIWHLGWNHVFIVT